MVELGLLSRDTVDARRETTIVAAGAFLNRVMTHVLSGQRKTVLSLLDVDPFRIGGAEAHIRELSLQLGEHGWKNVLCFNAEPAEAVLCYLALPNLHIEVLKNPSSFRWQTIRNLVRIMRRYRPQILHMQFTPFLSPYPWLARLLRVKRVFFTDQSSRSSFYAPGRAALWKRIAARVINQPMTAVICISDYVRNSLKARDLLPPGRLLRIYNAVDLSRSGSSIKNASHFRMKHSIPEGRTLIVQVSWLIPEKGISDLLRAAQAVVSRAPNAHFVFVGDGAYRNQFIHEAGELRLTERVTWTGLVVDPLREGVYGAADIVCQVSRWQEGFGWTIAEAMSCSKPVIATRVGGIPELVRNGLTGFLVQPSDPAAIAEKIIVLLENTEMRRRMGQAGREVAESNFDLRKNVRELIELYGVGRKPTHKF